MTFSFHRRRSFFPLLVALLSVSLLGFMMVVFLSQPPQTGNELTQEPVSTISSEDYHASARAVVASFDQKIQVAQDVPSRRAVVQSSLSALLALRVPVEYQNAHLHLALALNAMQSALGSDDQLFEEALAQWREAEKLLN